MKLIGNKGEVYVGPNDLEVHVYPTGFSPEHIINAPLKDLPKWIKKLEITSTEDGGVRMGSW